MNHILHAQRLDRTKPFIGRHKELNDLANWLDDPQAPMQIYYLSGMGGIGKSSLMAEMMLVAGQYNTTCIWLDGRSCTQTPVDFLEYISSTISLEFWNNNRYSQPLELLFSANAEQRLLLCIDNYEHLSLLEGWMMKVFLPKLPLAGIAIILASRAPLSLAWKMNRFWSGYVTEMPLTHFSYEESEAYVRSIGIIQQKLSRALVRASNGHPLALALTVEAALKKKELSPSDKQIVSQTISAQLLRDMTSLELLPIVDALIVLQHANQEMLSQFLEQEVTLQQYRAMQEMSFIKTGTEGLALHDLARMHLIQDLRIREPQRLIALQAKAIAFLYRKLQSTEQSLRREVASRMLILCKDSLQLDRMYADLTVEPHQSFLESIRTGDLPILHQILDEWCEYSVDPWQSSLYHAFLDELAERFPESIVVLRGSDDMPIAMFIAVLLYEKTTELLTEYFPNELAECCDPDELLCDPDKADTYYAVLGAATNDHPVLTREELVGLLTLDRLSLLGEGSRAVLVATNSNLKRFLQQLGFSLRPTLTRACDTSYAQADVLELDLRNDGFGKWIMTLFPEPSGTVNRELSEDEVRKLLLLLHKPDALQDFVCYFPKVKNGLELQKHLLSILADVSYGLSEQDRELLKNTYEVYPGNTVAAASSCHMSRSTYYRHLRKALSSFSKLLRIKN